MAHIVGVGEDGEAEHAEDLHVDEVTAIGEAGEGRKDRPGKEIIDRASITLADIKQMEGIQCDLAAPLCMQR